MHPPTQAAAIQALGFIAERTRRSQDHDIVALTICELVLPFTLQPQSVDILPPGALVPAQVLGINDILLSL